MGVLLTIIIQRVELTLTRDEMKRSASALEGQVLEFKSQKIESMFFQMLNLHNNIVNSLDIKRGTAEFEGRDCFTFYVQRLSKYYNEIKFPEHCSDIEKINKTYAHFWSIYRQDLGHYFRFLFNFIRIVDSSNSEKIEIYVKLIRAQLSDYELVIIFYNCLSEYGKSFERFVHKYDLFDNLDEKLLLRSEHRAFVMREM